jgi:hypothetical protein
MEKDGSKRSRVDDVDPVVEIISRQPTSVSNIAHFVKEFIESEENLLEAEKKAHAEAVQELEELVVKEGHDPEFQPDFLSVEMLRAQQKVLDTEPTVDEDALRRLDNLQFFFQDRVREIKSAADYRSDEEQPKKKRRKSKKHKLKKEGRKSGDLGEETGAHLL